MWHYSIADYLFFSGILIVIGIFSGFVGSFFGVGGGSVLVPFFLMVYSLIDPDLSVDMHQAVGSSLALTIFNTISAARKHYVLGNLPLTYFKSWGWWLMFGSIIGGILIAFISSYFLKILFAIYLLFAVIYGIFKKSVPEESVSENKAPQGIVKNTAATIIGGISVLLGLAGGTFATPFLTFFKYPMKKAMAISVAGGVIIGFCGSVAAIIAGDGVVHRLPLSLGYINIFSVVLVAPFVVISSPWGVRLAHRLSEQRLQQLYILFLGVLLLYLLLNLFFHRGDYNSPPGKPPSLSVSGSR